MYNLHPSVCLSVCPSVCLAVCLSVPLSVHRSRDQHAERACAEKGPPMRTERENWTTNDHLVKRVHRISLLLLLLQSRHSSHHFSRSEPIRGRQMDPATQKRILTIESYQSTLRRSFPDRDPPMIRSKGDFLNVILIFRRV